MSSQSVMLLDKIMMRNLEELLSSGFDKQTIEEVNMREQHLFILWEKARKKEKDIISKIKQKFKILKEYEIEWTKDKFLDNLSSFYGFNHTGKYEVIFERGNGKFLAILVEDEDPIKETVLTAKGDIIVNKKMYTLKQEIRNEYFNGHYLIHCTNTVEETRHDICLLLGKSLKDLNEDEIFDGARVSLSQNLPAIDGWRSLEQVFYVLNETCTYAVLRCFGNIPHNFHHSDGDIDFMVEDPQQFIFTLYPHTNEHVNYKKNMFAFVIHLKVADEIIWLHFKFPLDGYYDFKMSKKILKTRVLNENNIYIPNDEMLFYGLLYHGIIHKTNVSKYYTDLQILAQRLGIAFEKDFNYLKQLINDYLSKNNYTCPMHLDYFRLRQDKNIKNKKLICNDNELFIYQNEYDTFIFSKWLIACEPNYTTTMLEHFGPYHNLEQHILTPKHKLYKEHKRLQAKGEIAWSYKKRFGRVMKTTVLEKKEQPLKVIRNLLGYPKHVESSYLIVRPEKPRNMEEGKTVNDQIQSFNELWQIEQLLEKFIGVVFDKFKTENSQYLKGEVWDAIPNNCLINSNEDFVFFDKEYTFKGYVDKSYMLWRILIYTNMNADRVQLYTKFCKQFNLEDKFLWCQYIDQKVHSEIWKNPLDEAQNINFIKNAYGDIIRHYSVNKTFPLDKIILISITKIICLFIPIKKIRKKYRDSFIKRIKHPDYKNFKRYFK